MLSQEYSVERERIIAEALAPFAAELRLVNVEHLIAFIVLERYAFIADIVKSSAELHFAPGFLELGHGGDVRLDWHGPPTITLDLILRPAGVTAYVSLTFFGEIAEIKLAYISFAHTSACPTENTEMLKRAIAINSIAESANVSEFSVIRSLASTQAVPSATPSPPPAPG
jgi:hypothetical protein